MSECALSDLTKESLSEICFKGLTHLGVAGPMRRYELEDLPRFSLVADGKVWQPLGMHRQRQEELLQLQNG